MIPAGMNAVVWSGPEFGGVVLLYHPQRRFVIVYSNSYADNYCDYVLQLYYQDNSSIILHKYMELL